MGPARKGVAVDAKGNVCFAAVNSVASLRVARVDGMVETIAGDTGWGGSLPIDEGPAAFIGNIGYGTAIGRPSTAIAIKGLPLEGADKGFILISSGKAVLRDNCIYKVWKNKEKGDRWWFKLFAGKGAAAAPAAIGQSAPVADVKFRGFPGFGAAFDGNIYFHDRGYLYRLDDEKDTLTCLLAREDYNSKVSEATGKKDPEPDTILAAEDGGFYVGFYNGTYPIGWVFKVSADRKTVEPIAKDAGGGLCDGPGLKTHYFGGPLLSKCCPKGNAFFGAIDDGIIRRWKDGRVSSLCRDGEWREFAKYGTWGSGEPGSLITHPYKDTQAPYWGRGWVMPPTADGDYFYMTYMLGCGTGRLIRVGPIDWNKPTAGPLVGGN
jgi:hypothetical protein